MHMCNKILEKHSGIGGTKHLSIHGGVIAVNGAGHLRGLVPVTDINKQRTNRAWPKSPDQLAGDVSYWLFI